MKSQNHEQSNLCAFTKFLATTKNRKPKDEQNRGKTNGSDSIKMKSKNKKRLGGGGLSHEAFANAKSKGDFYNPALISKFLSIYFDKASIFLKFFFGFCSLRLSLWQFVGFSYWVIKFIWNCFICYFCSFCLMGMS